MKNLKTLWGMCLVFFIVIISTFPAYAADSLWRMMHGEEDALILGTIETIDEEYMTVRVAERILCEPGSPRYRMLSAAEIPEVITISNAGLTHYTIPYHREEKRTGSGDIWYGIPAETGDHILIPINREGESWVNFDYGNMMYKADSLDLNSLRIVLESDYLTGREGEEEDRLKFQPSMITPDMRGTAASLEAFLRSGGAGNEFIYSNEEGRYKVFLEDNGQKTLIYETESGQGEGTKENQPIKESFQEEDGTKKDVPEEDMLEESINAGHNNRFLPNSVIVSLIIFLISSVLLIIHSKRRR